MAPELSPRIAALFFATAFSACRSSPDATSRGLDLASSRAPRAAVVAPYGPDQTNANASCPDAFAPCRARLQSESSMIVMRGRDASPPAVIVAYNDFTFAAEGTKLGVSISVDGGLAWTRHDLAPARSAGCIHAEWGEACLVAAGGDPWLAPNGVLVALGQTDWQLGTASDAIVYTRVGPDGAPHDWGFVALTYDQGEASKFDKPSASSVDDWVVVAHDVRYLHFDGSSFVASADFLLELGTKEGFSARTAVPYGLRDDPASPLPLPHGPIVRSTPLRSSIDGPVHFVAYQLSDAFESAARVFRVDHVAFGPSELARAPAFEQATTIQSLFETDGAPIRDFEPLSFDVATRPDGAVELWLAFAELDPETGDAAIAVHHCTETSGPLETARCRGSDDWEHQRFHPGAGELLQPTIAIDPDDPDAVAITWYRHGGTSPTALTPEGTWSADGGRTWTRVAALAGDGRLAGDEQVLSFEPCTRLQGGDEGYFGDYESVAFLPRGAFGARGRVLAAWADSRLGCVDAVQGVDQHVQVSRF